MPDAPTSPAAALQITLLGQFRVVAGGVAIPDAAWKLRKARALLKLLALAPGGRVPRDEALDLLWPDREPAAADNNLRGALLIARRALAPVGQIVAREGALTLRADGGLWVDVAAFEQAADRARGSDDARDYAAALDHYPGDLLPDDRYEDWTLAARERLRARALALLAALAAIHEATESWPGAIAARQRTLALEPADEAAHVGLMRLYARTGNRARALAQWVTLAAALRRELDAAPTAEATALRDAIAAGNYPPTVADDVTTRRRDTLPLPLTPLIGREADVVTVKGALGAARLVTLTGIGGAGKTRLALAVATALATDFPGGAHWVELATLADPALVPGAVAAAVRGDAGPGRQQSEGPSRQPLDALVAALRDRSTLLVLDNAEGLRAAVAELALALLTASPPTRLLVTSRTPLGLPGELVWPVPSLATPPVAQPGPSPRAGALGPGAVATIAASPAVRLFVERARERQPAFTLDAANATAVAEIARRLDGIPLALELAAARVALLPPAAIAAHLDDTLALLSDADRAGPPRHRTLRATLDWSAALLTPAQRRTLARLGLFVGGGTLAAIAAICAEPPGGAILDDLGALVAHSLVTVTEEGGAARYSLLEPTRQYAAALLAAQPDADALRERHTTFFCDLARGGDDGLIGPDRAAWTARLAAERANLRATLARLAAAGDAARGLPLAVELWRSWDARGEYDEGRGWFARFFALAPAPAGDLTPQWYARALFAAARLAYDDGDMAEAVTMARRLLALPRTPGDGIDAAPALTLLGHIAYARGDYDTAGAAHGEALALRRAAGQAREIAISLNGLMMAALGAADYPAAAAHGEESLTLALATGDRETAITTTLRLAAIARAQGEIGRAVGLSAEGLALARAFAAPWPLALALVNRADIAIAAGDRDAARDWLAESFTLVAPRERLPVLRLQLEAVTLLAAAAGAAATTLRLAGAGASLNALLGFSETPFLRARLATALAAARAALSPAAAEQAWREGRALDPAAARAAALAALAPPPPPH